MAGITTVLRDEDIQPAISQLVDRRFARPPPRRRWPGSSRSPSTAGITRRCSPRGYEFLDNVAVDDEHDLRNALDVRLRAYISALQNDPATAAKVDALKLELLDHPAVRAWSGSLWANIKSGLVEAGTDPDSELRQRLESSIAHIGASLRDDPDLRAKAEGWIQPASGYVVRTYAEDIADLISGTVARWDTDETSRRIELQVGRDLQFIRINGTVVGALAGLVIYTISQLLT